MGGLICRLITPDKNFSLVGAVERDNCPEIGKEINGVRIVCDLAKIIEKGQVVIEFTTPEATLKHLDDRNFVFLARSSSTSLTPHLASLL